MVHWVKPPLFLLPCKEVRTLLTPFYSKNTTPMLTHCCDVRQLLERHLEADAGASLQHKGDICLKLGKTMLAAEANNKADLMYAMKALVMSHNFIKDAPRLDCDTKPSLAQAKAAMKVGGGCLLALLLGEQACSPRLAPGSVVTISGLARAVEHNGSLCVLLNFEAKTGRWHVLTLPSSEFKFGKMMALRCVNLSAVAISEVTDRLVRQALEWLKVAQSLSAKACGPRCACIDEGRIDECTRVGGFFIKHELLLHLSRSCLMVGDEQHALRLFQTHLEVDAHLASVGCRVCLSREGLVYCGGCRVARLLSCSLVFLCDALLKQEGD